MPLGGRLVFVADEVEEGVDNVEGGFCKGVVAVLLSVGERDAGADEEFSEDGKPFWGAVVGVDGDGDAIGGSGVIKQLGMECAHGGLIDEVDDDLIGCDVKK